MAGDIKQKFGTAAALTCTLTGLTSNSARQSERIDNSSNLYLDVLVTFKIKAGTSVASPNAINVYAFGYDGTLTTENAGASDANITLTSPPNARLIGMGNIQTASTTYYFGPFSVASAFGGVMPTGWGIIVENKSGANLPSGGSDHAVQYQGVLSQYT